jgi:hypothetical protein
MLLNSTQQTSSWQVTVCCWLVKKFSTFYIVRRITPCSQQTGTGSYHEPNESNPLISYPFKIDSTVNITLASTPISPKWRLPFRFFDDELVWRWQPSGIQHRVVSLKQTDVSEVGTASIITLMEAVRTSETSVNYNMTTRRYIPEDYHLHTRHRKNLKSHKNLYEFFNLHACYMTHPLYPPWSDTRYSCLQIWNESRNFWIAEQFKRNTGNPWPPDAFHPARVKFFFVLILRHYLIYECNLCDVSKIKMFYF